MKELLADAKHVYHLREYAVLENEDGTYAYVAWDDKSGKLSWIRGEARILDDVLAMTSITDEGEEEQLETLKDVRNELKKLPDWHDKTKYYCAIVGGSASLVQYCPSGKPLKHDSDDQKTVQEMLRKHGVMLALGG